MHASSAAIHARDSRGSRERDRSRARPCPRSASRPCSRRCTELRRCRDEARNLSRSGDQTASRRRTAGNRRQIQRPPSRLLPGSSSSAGSTRRTRSLSPPRRSHYESPIVGASNLIVKLSPPLLEAAQRDPSPGPTERALTEHTRLDQHRHPRVPREGAEDTTQEFHDGASTRTRTFVIRLTSARSTSSITPKRSFGDVIIHPPEHFGLVCKTLAPLALCCVGERKRATRLRSSSENLLVVPRRAPIQSRSRQHPRTLHALLVGVAAWSWLMIRTSRGNVRTRCSRNRTRAGAVVVACWSCARRTART